MARKKHEEFGHRMKEARLAKGDYFSGPIVFDSSPEMHENVKKLETIFQEALSLANGLYRLRHADSDDSSMESQMKEVLCNRIRDIATALGVSIVVRRLTREDDPLHYCEDMICECVLD